MTRALLALFVVASFGAAHTATDSATLARGRSLFLVQCARCHGALGLGNGPDAVFVSEAPADLRRGPLLSSYSDAILADRILGKGTRLVAMRRQAYADRVAETAVLYDYIAHLPALSWPSIERGRAIYGEQSAVGDAELHKAVRHPIAGAMHAISERETVDLVRFVRLLSPDYELYTRLCSPCHGTRGEGGTDRAAREAGITFDDEYFRSHRPDRIQGSVWRMLDEKLSAMPHFEGSLSAADARAILAYLRSLPPLP